MVRLRRSRVGEATLASSEHRVASESRRSPEGGPVTLEGLREAIRWAEHLEIHAARIYAPVLEAMVARELAKRIKAGKLPSVVQVKTVADKGWSGLTDTDAVRKALESLRRMVLPVGWSTSGEVAV